MCDCRKSREYLESWGVLDTLGPIILHGEEGFPNDGTDLGQKAVSHLQSCASCKTWLKSRVDPKADQRIQRLNQYCCPMMFGAVEKSEPEDLHLKLVYFRDERFWIVDQPEREFGFVSFSYCPWCGKRLPENPFIDDEKGIG